MIQIQITEKKSINDVLKNGVGNLLALNWPEKFEIESTNVFNGQIIIFLKEKEQ